MKQIAANAGLDGSVILDKIKTSGKAGYGFDAYKEEYCDMIERWHRGSHQGDPFRSGERLLRRFHPADHRVSGGRQAPSLPPLPLPLASPVCLPACTNSYGLKEMISAPAQRAGALCVMNAYF